MLKKIVQSQVSRITNTPLKIDHFHTDLFTYVELNKVVLGDISSKKPAVFVLDEIKVDYNFWPIFGKKITVKNIQIDNPKIRIQKDSIGNYNFPINFLNSQKDSLSGQKSSQNGFKFELHNLKINNMMFSYADLMDSMKIELNKINLATRSTALVDTIYGQLSINDGIFSLNHISEQLLQLKTNFKFANNIVNLNNLMLETSSFKLQTSGQFNLQNQEMIAENLSAQLDLSLLNKIIIPDRANHNEGIVSITGRVSGFLNDPDASFQLQLAAGSIFNFPLENVKASMILKNDEIKLTDLALETLAGQAVGNGLLNTKELLYAMNLSFYEFQLGAIFERLYGEKFSDLHGIVSSKLSIYGKGNNWKCLTGKGHINLTRFSIRSKKYDDIRANIQFDQQRVEFNLDQDESAINLKAGIHPDNTISGSYEGHLSEVEPLAILANLDGLKGRLEFEGDFNGAFDSLSLKTRFNFGEGGYQGIPLSDISGSLKYANDQVTIINLVAQGNTSNLETLANYLSIDSLSGELSYYILANGNLDELQTDLEFNWVKPHINTFNFDELALKMKGRGKQLFLNKIFLKKHSSSLFTTGKINLDDEINFAIHSYFSEVDSSNESIERQGNFDAHAKITQGKIDGKISGEGIQIPPVLRLLGSDEIKDGTLNFNGAVYGHLNQPNFDLHCILGSLNYKNKSIDSLRSELKYFDNLLSLSHLSISKGNGWIQAKGTLPIDLYNQSFSALINPFIQVDAGQFDLNLLEAILQDSISIAGELTSAIQFQGNFKEPQLTGYFSIDSGKFATPHISSIDSMVLRGVFSGQNFRLEKMSGKINQFSFGFSGEGYYYNSNNFDASLAGNISKLGSIQIYGNRQPDHVINAKVQIDNLNLANLVQIVPFNQQLIGAVDISLEISGKQQAPIIKMILTSDQVGIEKARLDSVEIRSSYADNEINIYDSGFRIAKGKIKFAGNIPINYPRRDSLSQIVSNINFESSADNFDINWLRPLFSDIAILQGKVDYHLKVTGSVTNPDFKGDFNLQNGMVKFKDINPAINGINMAIHFDDDSVRIDEFNGKLETGVFNLHGQAHIKNRTISDTKFALSMDKIKLFSPKIFSMNIENGDLALTQKNDLFYLSGNILIKEAKYVQDYKPKISQFLTQIPKRSQRDKNTFLNDVILDVIIQGQENILVENNLAKLQMSTNLNLVGTLEQPNISGRIVVKKGYVLYLDRKFKITDGMIDFTDPHRINPYIDITAICDVTDYQNVKEKNYTITLKLTGLLEKPDFLLVSEPQLDKADIVAILTIGRTRENLFPKSETAQGQSFQQIMLNRFKEITSQRIAGMTEQKLSRTLALENVTIEGNLFQLDKSWGPRVTATKKLSDRINITYSTVVGHANEQQIKLGYQLYKYLSIVGNTGQTGQSGLDLRFQFKFY